MRKGVIIFAVGALVVGGATFVWTRDPQPPPPEPAVNGRLDVQRLLRARAFADLTRVIESRQARIEADIRREGDLALVVRAFDSADPTLTPLIDEWVEAAPSSYAARLARAQHGVALAWNRRGAKFAKDTSDEQFKGMAAYLEGVVKDARTALDANPRLGEAHRLLITTAMGLGNPQGCIRLAERGLEALPASQRIRVAQASCLLPRWGGSYELVEALARESDKHARVNPALAALHGFVEWDRGRLAAGEKRIDEAIQHYTRALAAGEHWNFYYDRARAYVRLDRHAEALADADRALALMPDEPDALVMRARALAALGRVREAVADTRLVAEIEPTNEALAAFRENEIAIAVQDGYRLVHETKEFGGAITRLTTAIDLTGGSAEIYYWRGRAYLLSEDHPRALADFDEAIKRDPRHFESCLNADYILATRGDLDGAIRRWSAFLAVEPANGRAYFERGGAYNRKGNRQAALNDARQACDLGVQQACDILTRAGER